jgi:mRNA capping enzyme, beta chain
MAEKRLRTTEESRIPPSIMGISPVHDVVSQVSEWLRTKIKEAIKSKSTLSRSEKFKSIEIEIEGKLGHVIDKQTRQRLALPILSETIVNNTFKEVPSVAYQSLHLSQICRLTNILASIPF